VRVLGAFGARWPRIRARNPTFQARKRTFRARRVTIRARRILADLGPKNCRKKFRAEFAK
jgi:hypothetical protein